jgi:uncharacterized protein
MAKTPLSKRVVAVVALLFLAGISYSCSSNTGSGVGRTSTPSPQTTPDQSRFDTKVPLPPPTGFVNDYANVLDAESSVQLETVLSEVKEKSNIEFAVAIVETTGDQSIFDYSLALAKGWGVGPRDTSKGGGVLLLVATQDRAWRIQVSRSLEKDLPDKVCEELGNQSLDLYRQGKYAEGVIKYVKALIERLEKVRGFELDSEL